MEGVINPLAVRDPWRCSACGLEWLVYDLDEPGPPACPRCDSSDVGPLRSRG
jgi:predicted Zn-ribbon and HTH transcriptional regulator